jgi:3-methyl-2-oxobutanoate hydroxymethyltransferase
VNRSDAKRVSVRDFHSRKQKGERLVMVSAYDALFARLADDAGVDAILVGDSLGNVIAGLESTVRVTLDQMIYHATIVQRGAARAMVVGDMPFLTYQVTPEDAVRNAGRMMQESGVQAVKVEGATPEIVAAVRAVTNAGIPVMGHLGYTPQSMYTLGPSRVQGREPDAASRLVEDAKRLEDAGAFAMVLELIPAAAAAAITAAVHVPTIGIGAGAACDGQVLVLLDLLGMNDQFSPKFLRRYAEMAEEVRGAVRRFGDDVRGGRYPGAEHSF